MWQRLYQGLLVQPPLGTRVVPASSRAFTNMTLPCCAALITLFTPFEYLSDATSISTLFSFFLVAASLLWRRFVQHFDPISSFVMQLPCCRYAMVGPQPALSRDHFNLVKVSSVSWRCALT